MCTNRNFRVSAAAAALFAVSAVASAQTTFFFEDFEGVTNLQEPVDEVVLGDNPFAGIPVWSTNPSSPTLDSWNFDNSNVPGEGTAEWKGWSVANKDFWVWADDQQRSQFDLASGHVAVADPDEYDDKGTGIPGDTGYEAYMTTGDIDISQAVGMMTLSFASSWRPEDAQIVGLRSSYDGGTTWNQLFTWDSSGANFKADAVNEMVMVDVDSSLGDSVRFEFGMYEAGNDWWWAVDNIKLEGVPEPATMTLLGLGALAALRRKKQK